MEHEFLRLPAADWNGLASAVNRGPSPETG
jgi:hypothetical protein